MDFSRPDNARKINKLKVLNILRRDKKSRAELSRLLSISKVSISEIVESLIQDGLIEYSELDKSTAGRPAKKLSIKRNAGRVFSVEIKKSTISVSVSDTIGVVLRFERFPRSASMWDDITSTINKLAQDKKIYGVCFVLSEDIEIPSLPFDYIIASPSIAQAKAEMNIATSNLEGFYFVSWSEHIEAVFYHNTLMPIPEFAHIKVTKEAPCYCGGNGCLEAVASGERLKEITGVGQLRDLASMKETATAAKALVFALSQAVQSTGAKAVMITGELSNLSDEEYATMQTRLTLSLPPNRENVFIYRAQSGERGTREGAGIIALDKFFYNTDLVSTLSRLEAL